MLIQVGAASSVLKLAVLVRELNSLLGDQGTGSALLAVELGYNALVT